MISLLLVGKYNFITNYNKMLSMHNSKEQIFVKLRNRHNVGNLYQYCMNEAIDKQAQNCCRTKKPVPAQRISIKAMLKRNQLNSQSCTIFSQANRTQVNEHIDHDNFSKMDNFSIAKQSSCYMNYDRGYVRTNSMQSQLRAPAKQINISYQNQQPRQSKMNEYYEVPVKCENMQSQIRESKKGGFNEFLSFGPKNLQIFRKINSLEINHVQSDIIEQTQRTEKAQGQRVEVKRLTKTCSQVEIQRQIGKFSTSALYNQSKQFQTSQLFTSIKHAETMKNGLSSDHQSEVVQNFQSLIEKVKCNRLQNWSITS